MSIEQKALKACRRYAELVAAIKQAGRDIGRNLDECPGKLGTLQNYRTGAELNCDDATHLSEFLTRHAASYAEQKAIGEAMRACPHCAAAYQLIQDRKQFRQQLGATKRFISKIGKEEA